MEVLLTFSPSEFEEFSRDLEELRQKLDASSNTQAVIEAVRRALR